MRRKTLLNRNVIIVLMLFIFLLTAFISTAYSLWYFPDSGSSKTVDTDIYQDDIDENFKALLNEKDTYGSYLKIIDCRDGVIPDYYTDFAMQSGLLDNSENFTDNGNFFIGKNKNYKKKVFGVSSLCHTDNESYKYPKNPKGKYDLGSFVSSVFYGSGTSMTEIYLYDLLNSQYKLVDHLTHESIELINRNGTSSDGGDMDKTLDAESYSSTKSDDYREKIGNSFSKSRILFLVPRDTELIKQPETPKRTSNYNIYFHNEATNVDTDHHDYRALDYVWLWNDRTDFEASLPLNCSETIKGTSYKSLHIKYKTLYKACNDKEDTNESGFIMTPQTAPTGIIFKTKDGTNLAPKDNRGNIEYLALPLPPINSTSSHFNIYINADSQGKFTISTDQDVDLTKNKNIVYYSTRGLDHLWTWSTNSTSGADRWISSNYVYKFKMDGCNKPVSCFSYNYGEKFDFYKNWNGPADGSPQFSPGFTFDKNEAGEKINYNYDRLILVNYKAENQTGNIDISGLFNGTSECTSIYLIENNKYENGVKVCSSRSEFIDELNQLN